MFQPFQPNYPSICIPRVFSNISERKIRETFESMHFGALRRIDMVLKTSERGEKYYRVFIHFCEWNQDEHAFNARMRLINGDELQVYYNAKYFWNFSALREKSVQPSYPMYPPQPQPQPCYLPPLQLPTYPMYPPVKQLPHYQPFTLPPLPFKPQPPKSLPPIQIPHVIKYDNKRVMFRLVDEKKKHSLPLRSPPPPPSSPDSPSPRSPISPPPFQEKEIKYSREFLDPDETPSYENWQIDYKQTAIPKRRISRKTNK